MIRTLSFSLLSMLLALIVSPLALADVTNEEITEKACLSAYESELFEDDPNSSDILATRFLAENIEYSNNRCGDQYNPATNSLEVGDCVESGALAVVEVIEPLGPNVKLGENEKIVDVYKGVCCLSFITNEDGSIRYVTVDVQNPDGSTREVTKPAGCRETREVYKTTFDECNSVAAFCERRQWLISGSGAGLIKVFVKQIYIFGAGIVGFLAVAVIVVSGIQISVSGVSGDITAAKDRIIQSIGGIVLLFLSGLILYTINPNFFS